MFLSMNPNKGTDQLCTLTRQLINTFLISYLLFEKYYILFFFVYDGWTIGYYVESTMQREFKQPSTMAI